MRDTLLILSVIIYFYMLVMFFFYCARFIYLCFLKDKFEKQYSEEAEADEMVDDIKNHIKNYRIK